MKKINENILVSEYSIFEEYFKRGKKGILINTVNCEGFMGKGLALDFKARFGEEYFLDYSEKCKIGKIKVGKIDYNENFKIINFPTKNLYKMPSKLEWIILGLEDLSLKIESGYFDNEIIYIPKLGSSNGGQNWDVVYLLIKEKLLNLKNNKVKFVICEDFEAGDIEKEILNNLKNYNGKKVSEKILNKIKDNFYKIKRLRNLFDIDGIGEKTYKNILELEKQESLF